MFQHNLKFFLKFVKNKFEIRAQQATSSAAKHEVKNIITLCQESAEHKRTIV